MLPISGDGNAMVLLQASKLLLPLPGHDPKLPSQVFASCEK